MKLNAVSSGRGLKRGRIGLRAQPRHRAEKLFKARRGCRPCELQQSRPGIAQPTPRLPGDMERHPWQDGHGLSFKRRPPLALIDEQHLVSVRMAVDRDRGSRG